MPNRVFQDCVRQDGARRAPMEGFTAILEYPVGSKGRNAPPSPRSKGPHPDNPLINPAGTSAASAGTAPRYRNP